MFTSTEKDREEKKVLRRALNFHPLSFHTIMYVKDLTEEAPLYVDTRYKSN